MDESLITSVCAVAFMILSLCSLAPEFDRIGEGSGLLADGLHLAGVFSVFE
jgi:hypothetical protein